MLWYRHRSKSPQKEKKNRTEELRTFERMSLSNSDRIPLTAAIAKKVKFENWAHASYLT